MPELTVKFLGICTHLAATHAHPVAPPIPLKAGGDKDVLHRVFIPNSDLISTHLDPKRCVPPHIPKLTVPTKMAGDLAQVLTVRGDVCELLLKDIAIGFENVVTTGPTNYWEQLKKGDIPSIWDKSEHVHPLVRRLAREDWTTHAAAYVDFTTGAKFDVVQKTKDVTVTLGFLDKNAVIVFRPRNGKEVTKYTLALPDVPPNVELTISNLPLAFCGDSDYLLHYLATTTAVCEDAPTWPKPPGYTAEVKATVMQRTAAESDTGPSPEVYCSSSGYP